MQIKTTMRCYLRMALINKMRNKGWKGCGEKQLYTAVDNVHWYNHYQKQYRGSSEN